MNWYWEELIWDCEWVNIKKIEIMTIDNCEKKKKKNGFRAIPCVVFIQLK